MASYKVVLEVVVQNLDSEEEEQLHDDAYGFLADTMLLDDAEVVSVRKL